MSVSLRGLAWDHRRCWGPLDASVPLYTAGKPGLAIDWDRRSLYEFGEGRIEDVVREYDLIVFDHPFVGDVARDHLLVPFDDHLSPATRKIFEAELVGKSWASYQANGRQWALPIDAAAQVAAYRPDLLARYAGRSRRAPMPRCSTLGRRLRADGQWLGLPLVPTDAMCLVLTGAAIAGHAIGKADDVFLPEHALAEVLDRLRELAAPRSSAVLVVESDPLLRPHDPPRRHGLCALRLRLRELRLPRRERRISPSPTFRRRRPRAPSSAAPASG